MGGKSRVLDLSDVSRAKPKRQRYDFDQVTGLHWKLSLLSTGTMQSFRTTY